MQLITILAFALPALAAPGVEGMFRRPSPVAKQLNCPTNEIQKDGLLGDNYVNPSLLLPISASEPDKVFESSSWATITPNDKCTIFNLELPAEQTVNKNCSLVFDFPGCDSSRYRFQGPGNFLFQPYAIGSGAVAGNTTYNNQPQKLGNLPSRQLLPGNSYVINTGSCEVPAGTPGVVTFAGSLCSADSTLAFHQDSNECPLGFFLLISDA
ncbi:hypothetical protein MCOR25_009771 [Pyricularia grisea]|uniref:Ubiquitin 3 binding protein But2 C-terminal domain-containing protein n=1 Tax=Pyricularia grisea TaxID=148305 RepID=A0A6P8AZC9_PYRGI|nr:hypothetical protein PgNI_10072 [Pyricularia grisea]KAI6351734.1 hypothetical protein MCOR25_009771 [Pyricularia grisea]TLD07649.1 hypothetical protein PgNI_10072 [Pyricularia grisea]